MLDSLPHNLLVDRTVHCPAEALLKRSLRNAGSKGNIFRRDRFLEMLCDEADRDRHMPVGNLSNLKKVGASPDHHSQGLDPMDFLGERFPLHQAVEKGGALVADFKLVVVNARYGRRGEIAEQLVVVHAKDSHIGRDPQTQIHAGIHNLDSKVVQGSHDGHGLWQPLQLPLQYR